MYKYSCCGHSCHYYYYPSFQISVKTWHSNNSALTIMVTFKNIFTHQKTCFQSSTQQGHSFISFQKFYRNCYDWRLTPWVTNSWCWGSFTCCLHIRSFPFYDTNTEISQLSTFHSIVKCSDNILFLCNGVEFQCKVNIDTSTPWDRH